MRTLRLNFFGFPQLEQNGQPVALKTRKTFGLLLYLALEPGWHSRDKLVGLLWPEADQDQGRGSLRKSLTLMRQALGDAFPLVAEKERIRLEPSRISTDLALLSPESDSLPSNALEGVLRDFSLPDTAPFEEWLEGQRKAIQERLDGVMEAQMRRRQLEGQAGAALGLAQARAALDPLSEEAHLELMRLLWEQGKTSQALKVFRQFRQRLWAELGVNPSAAMTRLVQHLQGHNGTLLRPTLKSERGVNQVSLVGREHEWELMEKAWEKGQAILIGGGAGVGKSRLALEFCVSKGSTLRVWGRQTDEGIPYNTHARNFAYLFFDQPDVTANLPDWVKAEMARMVPWVAHPPGHPIRNQAEKARFLEAKMVVYERMSEERGWDMFFFDDAQFTDSATIELGIALQRQFLPYPPHYPKTVFAFRSDEMPKLLRDSFEGWVREGLAVWIELEPLPPEAVEQWLRQREVSGLTQSILDLTGGNPLFIHETLQMLEGRSAGAALPRSERARQVLLERLARLSPDARALAEVAAVGGVDFSFDMGEWVLGLEPESTSEATRELHAGGILKGSAFSHDLLYETALESVRPDRKAELSAQIAQYLEQTNPYIAPARLARYYLDSDQPRQAAGYLLEAGRRAVDTFVLDQAAEWYELAAQVLHGLGRAREALEAVGEAAELRGAARSG